MNTGKKRFQSFPAGLTCLTLAAICLLTACGGSNIPSAPIYATDLMDATTIEWKLEGDVIAGGYKIDHPGDPNHTYAVVVYLVSDKGKKLVSSHSEDVMSEINSYEWSDVDESARHLVDWPTAKIWCEILIYDESGDLIFHGVKTSDRFPTEDETDEE